MSGIVHTSRWAVLGAGLVLALSACGGGEMDTSSKESLAEGFSSALADGDGETICANVEGGEDWVRLTEGGEGWDKCLDDVKEDSAAVDLKALEDEPNFDDDYARWGGDSINILIDEDPDGKWIIKFLDIG